MTSTHTRMRRSVPTVISASCPGCGLLLGEDMLLLLLLLPAFSGCKGGLHCMDVTCRQQHTHQGRDSLMLSMIASS